MTTGPPPDHGRELRARAWARVARAAADVYARRTDRPGSDPERNAALFDAIAFAATEAKLDLAELVDAYLAGAPDLDLSEAWEDVEDLLRRIASVQELLLHRVVALPEWPERLAVRIAAHDLAVAAHRTLGDQQEQIERTRLAVIEILDRAAAAGASERKLDAFVRQLRTEQCDIDSVVAAAARIATDRAHRAELLDLTLPAPAWATTEEIAQDRGAPLDVVQTLVDDALDRGLLLRATPHGFLVVPSPSSPAST